MQILFGEKRYRLAESSVFRTQEIAMESVQLIVLESNHAPDRGRSSSAVS